MPQLAERISSKICSECKQRKDQALFSRTEWAKKDSVSRCLECKPVDANLQKRAKNSKVCAACNVDTPRDGFSKSQWAAGVKSKCQKCVETATLGQCKLTKTCATCGLVKPKADFSTSQWQQSKSNGSQCSACSQKRLKETHDQLVQKSVQSSAAAHPDDGAVPDRGEAAPDRGEVAKWILQGPLEALPSENLQSYRAILAQQGRKNFHLRMLGPDHGGIPAKEKAA